MKGCYIIVLVVERYENKTQGYALLAQLVEQRTLNPSVQSSSLCAPTTFRNPVTVDAGQGFTLSVTWIFKIRGEKIPAIRNRDFFRQENRYSSSSSGFRSSLRPKTRTNCNPTSKRITRGTASNNCDNTSGGVKMAASTKAPTMRYGRALLSFS